MDFVRVAIPAHVPRPGTREGGSNLPTLTDPADPLHPISARDGSDPAPFWGPHLDPWSKITLTWCTHMAGYAYRARLRSGRGSPATRTHPWCAPLPTGRPSLVRTPAHLPCAPTRGRNAPQGGTPCVPGGVDRSGLAPAILYGSWRFLLRTPAHWAPIVVPTKTPTPGFRLYIE